MTNKLREAAQAVPVVWMGKMDFEALKSKGRVTATLYGEPVGNKTNEVGLCLATLTPPVPQKHKPLFAEMIAQHPRLAEELAQQDAQAAPTPPAQHREPDYTICPTCGGMASDPIVPQEQISDGEFDADKRLMELADKIDYEQNWRLSGIDQRDRLTQEQQDRVTAGVMLRRYADLMAPDSWRLFPPKHLSGGLQCFRASTLEKAVEMAMKYQALNADPTPPARATLTASEILIMTPESIPAEHDGALLEYARAVIEAYERKNGISQPGYTAPDMASQGASQFRAGHDAAQSEIAELEQENRLLRARNDRLQKEIEQKGEQ